MQDDMVEVRTMMNRRGGAAPIVVSRQQQEITLLFHERLTTDRYLLPRMCRSPAGLIIS